MDPTKKSRLLFFLGCIPARILLVYIAYILLRKDTVLFTPFLVATFMIGIGFWSIYLNNWRKTGAETFGQKIWWNSLRPIHGTIYLLFSITASLGYKDAWIFLAMDVLIGLFAELHHISS